MVEIDANWLLICLGGGVLLGWVLGTIATMSYYNAKVGTPSASHNSVRNAIPASEAYCRKHASDKISTQRAFLDGVAWREQHP